MAVDLEPCDIPVKERNKTCGKLYSLPYLGKVVHLVHQQSAIIEVLRKTKKVWLSADPRGGKGFRVSGLGGGGQRGRRIGAQRATGAERGG